MRKCASECNVEQDAHHSFFSAVEEIEQRIFRQQEALELLMEERQEMITELQNTESALSELEICRLNRESVYAFKKCESQQYTKKRGELHFLVKISVKKSCEFFRKRKFMLSSLVVLPSVLKHAERSDFHEEGISQATGNMLSFGKKKSLSI